MKRINKNISVFLILVVIFIIGMSFSCSNKKSTSKDIQKKYPTTLSRVQVLRDDPNTIKYKTPMGVTVQVEPGVIAEQWELEKIDEGFTRTFTTMRCLGYDSPMFNHSVWQVALMKSVLSPIDKVPSIEMPYFGGVGGVDGSPETITAAGEFLTLNDDYLGNLMALADHTDQNSSEALTNAAQYEMEHGALAVADSQKYMDTRYHQTGGHPLISCNK